MTDERGVTALCPECGMDAVVGDGSGFELDYDTLKALNLAFYGEDYMEKHPVAAAKYIERYRSGKITHKKANESLYIQYLSILAEQKVAPAAQELGDIYANGTEFTPKDPQTALTYYTLPILKNQGSALVRIGKIMGSGAIGTPDPKAAYECFSKAMALASMEAVVAFADCYKNGTFVPVDLNFYFTVLWGFWSDCYYRFVSSTGKVYGMFPDVAYRLGMAFYLGEGTKKNLEDALRYLLYAEASIDLAEKDDVRNPEYEADKKSCSEVIDVIKKKFGLVRQEPVFDEDTFVDTLEFDNNDALNPEEKLTITGAYFDKANGAFEFDLTSEFPMLILDCGNLFCGFVSGTIHWVFDDVESVKCLPEGGSFTGIDGDSAGGWDFYNDTPNGRETVCSIHLKKPEKHIKTGTNTKKTKDSRKA